MEEAKQQPEPKKRSFFNRRLRRIAANFKDISEENEHLKTQLHQVQRIESMGKLAGGIAHDIKNLLCPVTICADLIRISNTGPGDRPKDPELMGNVNGISLAAEKINGLIGKLLVFTRQGSEERRQMDIHIIIPDVVNILKHTLDKKISVRQELDATHSFIMGDPSQIEDSLLNIAINARDAMPNGGILSIQTRNFAIGDPEINPTGGPLQTNFIEISISDTGMGMTEEVQKKIFNERFTTKEAGKGTGFGLSNVYSTIKSHRGIVNFSSDPGKGTIFRVYLPYVEPKPEKKPVASVGVGQAFGKVMIVDDEPSVAESTSDLLEAKGYSVLKVSENVKSALEYYRLHWQEIDVVLLGLIMPDINGLECFREMRKINPKSKIVLYSGCSEEDAARMQEVGMNGFLPKPFSPKRLTETLRSALKD